jgi:hypothetical protein
VPSRRRLPSTGAHRRAFGRGVRVGVCVGPQDDLESLEATFVVAGVGRCQAVLRTTEGAPCDRAACRDGSACVTGEAVIQAASSANFRRFLTRVCRLANSC